MVAQYNSSGIGVKSVEPQSKTPSRSRVAGSDFKFQTSSVILPSRRHSYTWPQAPALPPRSNWSASNHPHVYDAAQLSPWRPSRRCTPEDQRLSLPGSRPLSRTLAAHRTVGVQRPRTTVRKIRAFHLTRHCSLDSKDLHPHTYPSTASVDVDSTHPSTYTFHLPSYHCQTNGQLNVGSGESDSSTDLSFLAASICLTF